MDIIFKSPDDYVEELGQQIRELRITKGFDQDTLARTANISLGSLKNLEAGKGSTLATLVRVTRALGREQWLESFHHPEIINPMRLLRDQKLKTPRQRVYKPRKSS